MKKTSNKEKRTVPFGQLLAWQTRAISLGAITIIIAYFSLYCTDTLGMRPAIVGTLLMASKFVDGFTDLVAGYLVDNTHTRLGKARPYEISIIFAWIFTVLLFSTSPQWSNIIKSVWIFAMYTLIFSVFSTFLNAAESPYIIRAFGDKEAVTKVSALGGLIVTIGCMVVSISFPILMGKLAISASGWRQLILIYALPLIIIGLLRFIFVKEKYDAEGDSEHVSFKDMFKMLRNNPYAWCMAGENGATQFVIGLGAATYYFTWVVGDIGKYSIIQMLAVVSLLVMLVFPIIINKKSANFLVFICAIAGIIGYAVNFFAGSNMPVLVIAACLTAVSALPVSYLRSVLIMDISKYNQWKGLPPMESTASALANFFGKVFTALGSFILGIMLEFGGYNGSLNVQSDSAMMMIRILYSIIPMIAMIVMVICSVVYRSLDKQLPQIEVDLAKRETK